MNFEPRVIALFITSSKILILLLKLCSRHRDAQMVMKYRDIKAMIITLKEGEERKPSQVVKRIVFSRFGIVGTDKDRFLTAIFYGLMRKLGCVDKVIEGILGEKVEDLDPWLRASLRLLTYLKVFTYCDRQSMENLVEYTPKLLLELTNNRDVVASFNKYCNKIIHANSQDLINKYVDKDELLYSMPKWLILKAKELVGGDYERLLKAMNIKPLISFRVNTLKATLDDVVEELESEGYEVSIGEHVPIVVKVKPPFKFNESEVFRQGKIVPQDEACAAAALVLDPQPGEVVVDMCAAPGGKATHMAELMENEGIIYAFDIHDDRIRRMRYLIRKTGVKNIKIFKMSCTKAPKVLGEEIADKVLLDPPCSTTGSFAKYPESRWRLTDKTLEEIVERQIEFLKTAVRLVKPGGRILYTVCSILPEEGEEVIKTILSLYPDHLELVEIRGFFNEGFMKGTIRSWPHIHNTSGMFFALLEKVDSLK